MRRGGFTLLVGENVRGLSCKKLKFSTPSVEVNVNKLVEVTVGVTI